MNLQQLLAKEVPACFREKFIDYDRKMETFAMEIITNYNDRVRIADIVGCNNKYECNSWYEVFYNASRMERNLELLRQYSTAYYHSSDIKQDMQYIAVDGQYFVDCGKHRTCIAKALSYFEGLECIKGVTTITYKIDYEFMHAYAKLVVFSQQNFWKSALDVCCVTEYDASVEVDNGIHIEKHQLYVTVYIQGKFRKWYLKDIQKFLSMHILQKFIYVFICMV